MNTGKILEATHQEGRFPTQYSNIYDVKNQLIYLYHFHNFQKEYKIDLKKELAKGKHSYNIPSF